MHREKMEKRMEFQWLGQIKGAFGCVLLRVLNDRRLQVEGKTEAGKEFHTLEAIRNKLIGEYVCSILYLILQQMSVDLQKIVCCSQSRQKKCHDKNSIRKKKSGVGSMMDQGIQRVRQIFKKDKVRLEIRKIFFLELMQIYSIVYSFFY